MDDSSGGMWGLLTIIGPILLAAALLWALLRNRKAAPSEDAKADAAAHRLRDEIDAEDTARDNEASR